VEELKKAIEEAQLVLVGIGMEFAQSFDEMQNDPYYKELLNRIEEIKEEQSFDEFSKSLKKDQLLQYLKYHYLKKHPDASIREAYDNLYRLLENKNYFIVSLCTDDLIYTSNLDSNRIVTPCGGYRALQCGKECVADQDGLVTDKAVMDEIISSMDQCDGDWDKVDFPVCAECCKTLWFNQIGTPDYNEGGYLEQWKLYTKWLQGTLNKKICILELGAGLQFPQIIRFPFEKIAFYNQKASFFRIHSKLYQLTEELKDKGIAVKENPVDFLLKG